jgi:NifB/MoaA-like Fe-S oxidoreductase
LRKVDAQTARETLKIAGKRACCSDEFFLLANEPIPPAKYYGNFSQLADGVGAIRLLLDEFAALKLPQRIPRPLTVALVTSYAAKTALEIVAAKLNKIENLTVQVTPVKSNYWGDDITVAGLITSDDLVAALPNADLIVLPGVMFKAYSHDFLDGKTLDDVKAATGKNFLVVNSIEELLVAL